MIDIVNPKDCCGCGACVQRCPKSCIIMQEDKEGFLYPQVEVDLCIGCDVCERVCPMLVYNEPQKPLNVYAAKNSNEEQRLRSSSGGIFILFAEYIIKQGGVVFGARFDKNWEVEHSYAETVEDLEPLMRSKYVQSRIGNTYKEAEQFLKQGRLVLFVGTSCQIAGLHRFLRKEYENLFAVDFVCHGVPSPGVWRKYLDELKGIQTSRNGGAGKNTVLLSPQNSIPVITSINFREKQLGGYSWKKYGFVIHKKSPVKGDENSILLSTKASDDPFVRAFLSNNNLRNTCYDCQFKDGRSRADITMGDYWGIEKSLSDYADVQGNSVVFVHTELGKQIFHSVVTDYRISNVMDASRVNVSYYKPSPCPSTRTAFFKEINNEFVTLSEVVEKTIPNIKEETPIQFMLALPVRTKRYLMRKLFHKNF